LTPFGQTVRNLRIAKGVSQKQMAQSIGVSAAYLSALEHGKRGAPSFEFIQRVAGYFNIIWDEAEELMFIAGLSHPRVVIDTAGLDPAYTELANRLAREIHKLSPDLVRELATTLEKAGEKA
jgi:transcriptional regulator with XRE-family HTH domain